MSLFSDYHAWKSCTVLSTKLLWFRTFGVGKNASPYNQANPITTTTILQGVQDLNFKWIYFQNHEDYGVHICKLWINLNSCIFFFLKNHLQIRKKFIWDTLYSRREGGNDTCWRRSGFCFKHRGAPLNIVLVEKHDLLHVDDDKETLEFLT